MNCEFREGDECRLKVERQRGTYSPHEGRCCRAWILVDEEEPPVEEWVWVPRGLDAVTARYKGDGLFELVNGPTMGVMKWAWPCG